MHWPLNCTFAYYNVGLKTLFASRRKDICERNAVEVELQYQMLGWTLLRIDVGVVVLRLK
jgi:hypothetical protein